MEGEVKRGRCETRLSEKPEKFGQGQAWQDAGAEREIERAVSFVTLNVPGKTPSTALPQSSQRAYFAGIASPWRPIIRQCQLTSSPEFK